MTSLQDAISKKNISEMASRRDVISEQYNSQHITNQPIV